MPELDDQERKAGFSRLDSPDGKSAVYVLQAAPDSDGGHSRQSLEACVEMQVDAMSWVARRKGLDITPELEQALREQARNHWKEHERQMRAKGIPPHIMKLFEAVTKREAVRLASKMVITKDELTQLIFNSRTHLGYRHRLRVREFHPAHHETFSDDISEAIGKARPGPATPEMVKAMRKMHAIFEERKRVHAHMFERGAKWHCFFFDMNDVTDPEHGPHLHYISHRWPGIDRDAVLAAFDERRHSLPRQVHIRYLDESLEQPARQRRVSVAPTSGHVLRVEPAPEPEPRDGK